MATNVEMWDDLLEWLATMGGERAATNVRLVETAAGRGLVARTDLPPNTLLVSVPSEALLNTSTLRPFYPLHFTQTFTSTQWITLHLALQQDRHMRHAELSPPSSPSDKFWPFLASLPQGFPTVPLEWSIGRRTTEEICHEFGVASDDASLLGRAENVEMQKRQAALLSLMPLSVLKRAEDVEKRFKADWAFVQSAWESHRQVDETAPNVLFLDFLLAWLNVNSRCVYLDLGQKTSDNLTLAPIIDMINHADGRVTKPLQSPHSLSFSTPPEGSPDPSLRAGDELGFTYGAHEDPMLLAEYGFSLGRSNTYNNVGIDEHLSSLFAAQGEAGRTKQGILEDQGYWGDWTLQASPQPASASWRVLVALRLLHLPSSSLNAWYDVINGETDTISPLNESLVEGSIRALCARLGREMEEGARRCRVVQGEWGEEVDGEVRASLGMLRGVWEDEEWIVKQVARNVGVEN